MSAGKTFKFITLSTLIHSGCVLALMTSPLIAQLAQQPMGTGHESSLELTAAEIPQGEQTEIAAPKVEEPIPATEKSVEEKVAVKPVEKKPAEKKAEAKKPKAATKAIATELPPKEVVNEATEEAPDMPAVALVPASERAAQIEQLDPEIESSDALTPISNEVAETASSTDSLDSELVDEDEKALSTALEAEESNEQGALDSEESDELAPPASIAAVPATSNTGDQAGAAEAYGTSQGVRSYENLTQVPGNRPPSYPSQARLQRQEGQVILQYFVTSNGQVSNMKLVKSSGFVVLDKEAMTAVSQYKYKPGQEGWTLHPITFSLTGPEERTEGRLRTSMR